MLNQIKIDDQKKESRSRIESVENWLRRIINEELTKKYGQDYIDSEINKEIRLSIKKRFESSPEKYSRMIDASDLSHLIRIFCNPKFYGDIFRKYQEAFYPQNMSQGDKYLLFLFTRLYKIRCDLSHANEISIKDFEFVLYFTSAQINSYINFYTKAGKMMDYDVPKILEIRDSFGSSIQRKDFNKYEEHDFTTDSKKYLRPGDVISLEVTLDPCYQDVKSQFRFGGADQDYSYDNKLIYTIKNSDVCEKKVIHCQVRSDKDWHRQFNMDDQIHLYYKVLPPIEN